MGSILSFANQKGGVGRTTSAVSIASYFALSGKKVLLTDLDILGQCAMSLGLEIGAELCDAIVHGRQMEEIAIEVRKNLYLIRSNKKNEKIIKYLSTVMFREYFIAEALENSQQIFDLIVLDLAMGENIINIAALIASDYVVIPSKMDHLALAGVFQVLNTIQAIGKLPNVETPKIIGILPTMFDRKTNETVENLAALQKQIGDGTILPPIPSDTKVREASAYGKTIWEYCSKSPGVIGYPNKEKFMNSVGNWGGYLHLAEIITTLMNL
jgi:chromosome partitioning protein